MCPREYDEEDPAIVAAINETMALGTMGPDVRPRNQPRIIAPVDDGLQRSEPAPRDTPVLNTDPVDFINLESGATNFAGVETTLNDIERKAVLRIVLRACKRELRDRASKIEKVKL